MAKESLVGIVVIVVVPVGAGLYLMLPTGPKEYDIELRESSFAVKDGGTSISVRAGETVVFKIINVGGVDHEFMVVTDKDEVLTLASQKISELLDEFGEDEEAVEHEYEEWHEMLHHMRSDLMLLMVHLEPGESETVEFMFDEPGTYWMVCLELHGSFPNTHAEIIVEG
jgi:uncharacterized cupredoxin-like copper-binding protein